MVYFLLAMLSEMVKTAVFSYANVCVFLWQKTSLIFFIPKIINQLRGKGSEVN